MALPPSFTEMTIPCGVAPVSIWQMLAACMFNYEYTEGSTTVVLNQLCFSGYCDDLTAYWNCTRQGADDEQCQRAMIANLFAIDDCGNLALKTFCNLGTRQV